MAFVQKNPRSPHLGTLLSCRLYVEGFGLIGLSVPAELAVCLAVRETSQWRARLSFPLIHELA